MPLRLLVMGEVPIDTVIADPPVPRWITKHECFKLHLSSLCKSVDILSSGVFEQLVVYKSCMKEGSDEGQE